MHDSPCFVLQLQFFLRVTRVQKGIHLRDDIEGNLMWKYFTLDRPSGDHRFRLLAELFHRQCARSRNGLITRREHPGDPKFAM